MNKTVNSHLYELEVVKNSKPLLSFDESVDFSAWRSSAYDKLTELLGLPLLRGDSFEIEYKTEKDGYTEYLTVIGKKLIRVGQRTRGELIFYDTSEEDLLLILVPYFALDTDYEKIKAI